MVDEEEYIIEVGGNNLVLFKFFCLFLFYFLASTLFPLVNIKNKYLDITNNILTLALPLALALILTST